MTSLRRRRAPIEDVVSQTNSLGVDQSLNAAIVTTPAARDGFNGFGDDFGLFDIEIPTHRVVVEGTCRCRLYDVKARQISAGCTSISGSHALYGTGSGVHLNHATAVLGVFVDSQSNRADLDFRIRRWCQVARCQIENWPAADQ